MARRATTTVGQGRVTLVVQAFMVTRIMLFGLKEDAEQHLKYVQVHTLAPEVLKLFPCSIQLSSKFQLLIKN